MAIYSLSQRITVGTIGVAAWDARAAASHKPKIMEVGLSMNAATASVYGLGRPAAAGTQTTPVVWLDEADGEAPAGVISSAVAFSGAPTVPTQFLRRVSTPATIGAGIIWTFPRGLGLPESGNIVLWNITAAAATSDVWGVSDQ